MRSTETRDGSGECLVLGKLWHLVGSIMDEVAPALEALGMSPKAFFLLMEVAEHPFPAQLARKMHLPPPTVTYLVKQLEGRGLLGRRPEAGDLRRFRLVPTPEGLDALRKAEAALNAIGRERAGRVAPEDLAVFNRVVERVLPARGEGP